MGLRHRFQACWQESRGMQPDSRCQKQCAARRSGKHWSHVSGKGSRTIEAFERTRGPPLHPAEAFAQASEAPRHMLPRPFCAPMILFNKGFARKASWVGWWTDLQPVGYIIVYLSDQGDAVLKQCNGLLWLDGSLRAG